MDEGQETQAYPQRVRVRGRGSEEDIVAHVRKTIEEIHEIFRNEKETFDEENIGNLKHNPPEPVHFPIFIFACALAKDAADVPSTILVVTILISIFLGFVLSFILFLWAFGKMSGGWWKKAIIRWLWIRLGLVALIEMLPVIQLIPANTIFILMVHYKEKKIVRLFNLALEKMHDAGIMKYIT